MKIEIISQMFKSIIDDIDYIKRITYLIKRD